MPKKRQVRMLQDLALHSIGEYVTDFGKNIIRPSVCRIISQSKSEINLLALETKLVQGMKYHLSSSVPWHLYDKLSIHVLRAIENLVNEMNNFSNNVDYSTTILAEIQIVITRLTEIVIHENLRTIEFTAWPKIMRHVLYNKLHEMSGLEVLDLGSGSVGWRTSDIEKIIIAAVGFMKNLIAFTLCFDCTDNIVFALSENCQKLQKVDVTASGCVTDRSIPFLIKCHRLRDIKLFRTSVSIAGYANLLLGHRNLENIGRYDELGYVLEYIRNNIDNFKEPFSLRVFESRNVRTDHLYLLVEMCPFITNFSILRDEKIEDLSCILAPLNQLKELKILSCSFYRNGLNNLLNLKGNNIVNLHLEHVDEIDMSALVCISQSCPMIKSLMFYNCEFLELMSQQLSDRKVAVTPFQFLERIKCASECSNMHLEYLLSYCVNVKFIQLGSSTGIDDTTMRRILLRNPMSQLEELKILYSADLSMSTVKLLMENCHNLRRISELESWQGITSGELDIFRREIKSNNIELDTSPTLSLA
ncbi:SCF E3 ubiquitin ligase complex F-box protein pof2-like [Leptopilina heterotoma]|uniref:SCF E3 ubiquitin ligase complex F-box protein pof2-like n=1 Tax=Leptopilina heterotoma TaxID=63436 RepID=UPI001CAA27CF|nr:SCF E3 ubiquitin ligase complex F-box protein pof2-like [Leptopilina heterotoma]